MKTIFNSVLKCTRSFGYAFKGINYVLRNENNFIYHLLATVVIVIIGFTLSFTTGEWLLVIFLIGMVYTAELFNSAIEKLVDLTTPQYDYKAGIIKDVAAGAVLVASITALIIGLIIIIGHL
jgi:diacylglycerol kinase (ATP)